MISIHAPRKGSDMQGYQCGACISDFNPRSPQRERLVLDEYHLHETTISIHAPRKGSDVISVATPPESCDFNPRSPQRERRDPTAKDEAAQEFQSTLPAKGATPIKKIGSQ